jgi:copper chaperone CopZ
MNFGTMNQQLWQANGREEFNVKLIAASIGLWLFAGTALAEEATSELKVPAMDCAACTVVIKKALTQIKGVKTVDLNVDKRTATIVYEDTQVKQAEIQKTIEKAGFKTEPSK